MLHLTLFALAAGAAPCDDAVEHLAAGVPASAVAAVASTESWDEAGVDCLVAHDAARKVVVAASRSAGLVPPPDGRSRPFELALGGAWIPDRAVSTPGTVDLHLTWLPRPELGLEVTGAAGIQGEQVSTAYGRSDTVPLGGAESGALVDVFRSSVAATIQFAPLAGELTVGRRVLGLRMHVLTGTAAVSTVDDTYGVLQKSEDPAFIATRAQTHAALVVGGGLRVAASPRVGVRLQVDETRWIETYEATMLAMRHRVAASLLGTLRL